MRTVAQAVQRSERDATSESTALLPAVRPNQLNPGSRKADWRTIRKYLPATPTEPAPPRPVKK